MKKIKLTSKLQLNKETIANLNNEEMNKVNGGKAVASLFTLLCGPNTTTSNMPSAPCGTDFGNSCVGTCPA